MNISSHLSTSGVSQPPYPSPMIRSGDETLTESPRTLATDAGNKDGLIRMLLQNATPTPPPSGTSPMGPPHPTNLPPIPKWPTSPLNALASPSSVPTTPLTSPKALTPGIFSSTPAITVQPPPSNVNIITVDVTTDDQNSPFIYQISGTERDIGMVGQDHSYSRPWNLRSDGATAAKAARTLFVPRLTRSGHLPFTNMPFFSETIDVESVARPSNPPYETDKATLAMEEIERFADFANPNVDVIDSGDDWEESINKDGWIPGQTRLFGKVTKVLHADQLARLVHSEPIQRRLCTDKTAQRLRQIFAGVLWETKMTQWLHSILVDNLPRPYLSAYIDALQTLKSKVPTLVDKMMACKVPNDQISSVGYDGMKILLKRPWNPVASSLSQHRLRKLPGNPILILTPSGPSDFCTTNSLRLKHWRTLISNLGRMAIVTMPSVEKSPGGTSWTAPMTSPVVKSSSGLCLSPPLSPNSESDVAAQQDLLAQLQSDGTKASTYLRHMISSIAARVRDIKRANPERPVILVGWGIGAAINCQVASMESIASLGTQGLHPNAIGVSACVCLGFPMNTLDGVRGEPDDPILDMKTPVLFVIGENATQCRSDDVEDMRAKMKVTTGMVMVGGADDLLRVSTLKKKLEGVTQSMVDRCIVDEIREFLFGVLTSPPTASSSNVATATKGGQHDVGDGTTSTSAPNSARKSGSGRPRKRAQGSEGKPTKKSKLGDNPTATVDTNQSTSGTPQSGIKATPTASSRKRKASDGDLSKARKMLDMNQPQTPTQPMPPSLPPHINMPNMPIPPGPHLSTLSSPSLLPPPGVIQNTSLPASSVQLPTVPTPPPVNLLASSPLLTSALTSKTPLLPSSPSPMNFHPIRRFTSLQPPLPQTPISAMRPTTTMPTLSSILQPPRPTPIMHAGRLFSPSSSIVPSHISYDATPSPIMLSNRHTSPATATKLPQQTRNYQPPMKVTTTVPQSVTFSQSHHAIVTLANSRGSATSNFTVTQAGNKDNVYIVTLPQHQLKQLESGGMQFQPNQMLALMGGDRDNGRPTGARQATEIPVQHTATGGTQSPTRSQDRRNVAEILASLSGLQPEPPSTSSTTTLASSPSTPVTVTAVKSAPPAPRANLVIEPIVNQLPQQQEHQPSISTPTSSSTGVTITALKSQPIVTTTTSATECIGRISSTPAIPTTARVVRVLQSSRAVVATKSSPAPITTAALQTIPTAPMTVMAPLATTSDSTPTNAPSAVRSRKQTFTTTTPDPDKTETEDQESSNPSVNTNQSSASGPSASGSQSFEPDILEEDLDDAPYTPYAYAKKAKNKKGMKK